ncbi:MAG: nitroreductase family protein [bacterium]|nr:nitroreductase family protein [bacterium]
MQSHHGVKERAAARSANSTIRLLLERGSCRSYLDKNIPAGIMEQALKAGIHAPTGGNLQPYSIIKIENRAVNSKLAKLCGQPFVGQAPVNLLFCLDWRRLERWAKLSAAPFTATSSFRHFWISFQDTIISAQNICTAADALGLGCCYIGTVLEFFPALKKMFKLPQGVFPVVLLCLGYPKAKPALRKKLPVNVMVHSERYRDLSDRELGKAFDDKYPGMKVSITPERLKVMERICLKTGGPALAKAALKRIQKDGFGWFKKYVPFGE